MADGLDILGDALTSKMEDQGKDDSKQIEGVSKTAETIQELLERLSESLTDEMQRIIDAINGSASGGENSEAKMDMEDLDVEGILEAAGGAQKEGGDDKDGGKKTSKTNGIKPDDLKAIKEDFSLGGLLVYWKLDEIQKWVVKNLGGGKGASGGGDSKKKDTKGKIEIGGGKGLKELSEAMIVFAKAAMLLAIIPKAMALLGITFFIMSMKMLTKAKDMIKEVSSTDFKKFTKTLKEFGDAVKSYAIAVLLLVLTTPLAILAIPGLLIMSLFMFITGKVAQSIKGSIKDYAMMCIGVAILSVGFLLFGVALLILAKAQKNLGPAMITALALIGFVALTALLGLALQYAMPFMILFPIVAILMSVGYMLLGLTMLLLSKLKIDWDKVNENVNGIMEIVKISMMLGLMCIPAVVVMVFFAIFAVLFGVGMILMLVGVGATFLLSKILSSFDVAATLNLIITGIVAAVAANMGVIIKGTVTMIFLTIFGATFMIAMTTMFLGAIAMLLLSWLLTPKFIERTWGPEGSIPALIKAIGDPKLIGYVLLGTVVLLLMVPFGVLFTGAMLAMSLGAAFLLLFKKAIDALGEPSEIGNFAKKAKTAIVKTLLGLMGRDTDKDKIGVGDLVSGALNVAAMIGAAVLLLPLALLLALVFGSFALMAKSMVTLKECLSQITFEDMATIIKSVITVVENLGDASKKFEGQSQKAIKAVGTLVKDIATALNMLVDIVIKLKDGVSEEQLNNAQDAIDKICSRLFGSNGSVYILFDALDNKNLKKASNNAKGTLKKLTPAIEGVSNLLETLVGMQESGKNLSTTKLSNIISSLNTIDWEKDFKPIMEMGKVLGKSSKDWKNVEPSEFQKIGDFLTVMSKVPAAQNPSFNGFAAIAASAPGLGRVVTSLNQMDKSLTRMESKIRRLTGFLSKLERIRTYEIGIVSAMNGNNNPRPLVLKDPNTDLIYQLMNQWNSDGVPIKAQINQETGEITPDDVGNETGKGEGRQ